MPQTSTPAAPSASARPSVRSDVLIDELIEVMLQNGFLALNIETLARALQCSKSTLYSVGGSRQEIIVTVIRAFFKRATERVESRMLSAEGRANRIPIYLTAIAEELAQASPAFFADVDKFEPAREIYRNNTQIAAQRVQQLVRETAPKTSQADATFVGVVARQIMEAIHRGEIKTATGLDDSAAYRALARLIAAGITIRPDACATTRREDL